MLMKIDTASLVENVRDRNLADDFWRCIFTRYVLDDIAENSVLYAELTNANFLTIAEHLYKFESAENVCDVVVCPHDLADILQTVASESEASYKKLLQVS